MWEVVALFTWPFWLALLLFLSWEIYEIERKQEPEIATVGLVVFVALLVVFTDWKPWLHLHIEDIIIYGVGYLAFGIMYMIVRYWIFLLDEFKKFYPKYTELKAKFDQGKAAVGTDNWPAEWDKAKSFREAVRATEHMPPYPWDRGVKGKIYMWMAYWPISGLWVLLHRPIEWFFDWAYLMLKQHLKDMADNTFDRFFKNS